MATYSQQFLATPGLTSSGGNLDSVAVPASYVWVVRDITLLGLTPPNDNAVVAVVDTGGSEYRIAQVLDAGESTYYGLFHRECRVVIPTGWKVRFYVNTGEVVCLVSGYALSAY